MSAPCASISDYLHSEIKRGAFPGAQYVVAEDGNVITEDAVGSAVVDPELIDTSLDTIYDLASLTKPLVTSMLCVMMQERGVIEIDAPIGSYLDELRATSNVPPESGLAALRSMTLKQLLTHTSGLANWIPLYYAAQDPASAIPAIARYGLESNLIGPQVVYSDLGYILLGYALEHRTNQSLDRLAAENIFSPLGLTRTMFRPPARLTREIAATERGQAFEKQNADAAVSSYSASMPGNEARGHATVEAETTNSGEVGSSEATVNPVHLKGASQPASSLRRGLIWGEVHDGNAYFLGGVAGHAGLFSTARETFQIANQLLPGSKLLNSDSLQLFTQNLTPGTDTDRSIGFVLASTSDCSAGPALPRSAFGHTGFTGTSIWIDPEKHRVFILLTNRVHPHVSKIDMKQLRQRFHAIAVEELECRN